MMGRLSGKVALVTGGAQGIGAAIARKFREHDAVVVIGDIQREKGSALAESIGGHFVELDVTQPESWTNAIEGIVADHGGIDVLVNNAGDGTGGPIESTPVEAHQKVVDLNLNGVWLGIRAAVPTLAARGGGSIVNISSIDGLAGVSHLSSYVATKFAVTGITKSLALELGDRGIRVNSVHPGMVDCTHERGMHPMAMARIQKAVERQPIKRMAKVEEIANAVLFFASDESSYCTGSELLVDGGHLAGPYRDAMS
ncbi:SDR family NAD(P)-dependent oxidoreductase [Novosphingobium sp. G106]|uniref:SDR family NAD(P)-dependent oxidoreductase n=1 Tax=Novosphingobium sp. G106 TaxID=2849500 RepID=UPI0020C2E64C|nr:glucose 1-dehydrogenase [Novosphingobium sp. G106]